MKGKYKTIGSMMVGDEKQAEKTEAGHEKAKKEGFEVEMVMEKK